MRRKAGGKIEDRFWEQKPEENLIARDARNLKGFREMLRLAKQAEYKARRSTSISTITIAVTLVGVAVPLGFGVISGVPPFTVADYGTERAWFFWIVMGYTVIILLVGLYFIGAGSRRQDRAEASHQWVLWLEDRILDHAAEQEREKSLVSHLMEGVGRYSRTRR